MITIVILFIIIAIYYKLKKKESWVDNMDKILFFSSALVVTFSIGIELLCINRYDSNKSAEIEEVVKIEDGIAYLKSGKKVYKESVDEIIEVDSLEHYSRVFRKSNKSDQILWLLLPDPGDIVYSDTLFVLKK